MAEPSENSDADPSTEPRPAPAWFWIGLLAAVLGAPCVGGLVLFLFNILWLAIVVSLLTPVLYVIVVSPRVHKWKLRADLAAPSPESRAIEPANKARPNTIGMASAKAISRDGNFATVPDVATTPGQALPHKLEPEPARWGWLFVILLLFTLIWNGVVGVAVGSVIQQFLAGNPVWDALVFLMLFVLMGAMLIVCTALAGLRWVESLLVGRVEVEISDHPLTPGCRADVMITQHGPRTLARVKVKLLCEESANYPGKRNTITDSKVVRQYLAIGPTNGQEFPLSFTLEAPADAMHSFKSPNNEIKWMLRVSGWLFSRLTYPGDFRLCVQPSSEAGQ